MQVSLTDRFVAGAKSAQVQTDYFDDNPTTRGLCLRVTNGGRKTWCLLFTSPRDRKRARITLGSYPATSLARARTLAIEAHAHLDDGRDPRDVAAEEAGGVMTVAALIKSYLEKHAKPNLRSAQEIERRLTKNVAPMIGNMKLAELHRRDVHRVVDSVLNRGKRVEAGRVFEDVRAMLRWTVARGDLDHNPMDGAKKPNGSVPRKRGLSDDEIRHLWNGLPTTLARSNACQRVIKLCLLTAQRVGEVSGMEKAELDLVSCTWTIPGRRTKNGHVHSVPLTKPALAVIQEALEDFWQSQLVRFPGKDGEAPIAPMAIAKAIGLAQRPNAKKGLPLGRFGIPHWTAHDLRRTAASGIGKPSAFLPLCEVTSLITAALRKRALRSVFMINTTMARRRGRRLSYGRNG